ncbi:hypothetical protein [Halomonas denitrificans]|uniref:hypothetical protein n=1 Tax=Halomonas denitrificans TaxID=370769 RepID=UPI0013007D91|nr:hypothetical protein [Halomonas denitrificans]
MKEIISNIFFNRAGFDVYRCANYECFPFIVDVIGPPGVGKSHLIKHLIKGHVLNNERQKIDKKRMECKSRALLLSLASRRIIDIGILQKKVTKALYDLNIHSATLGVMVDEGLCQHFMNELRMLASERPDHFDFIMKRRALINLSTSPKQINVRIRTRAKRKGIMRSYHQDKTEEELSQFNSQFLEQSEALVTTMRERNFSAITIDVSKGDDVVIGEVVDFLRSLESYKSSEFLVKV